MDYEKLDKYIQYVMTQVEEGNHIKEDLISDLKERGLSEEEINYVIGVAWMEGDRKEKSNYERGVVSILVNLIIPIILLILIIVSGGNVLMSYSFWIVIGAILILIFVKRKKKFK